MIDFRYHLISLIAVILALALGIIVGSGFLGGPLLDQLETNVDHLREQNEERLTRIEELESEVEQADGFAEIAAQYLIDRSIGGVDVVVFQFEGSNGSLVDGVKEELLDAGAQIEAEITLTQKLELATQPTADELALALGSVEMRGAALRNELATTLGDLSGAVAASSTSSDSPPGPAGGRLEDLLQSLQRSEFIGLQSANEDRTIPQGASFVVIGGNEEPSNYDAATFTTVLAEALSERGAPVLVVESRTSSWGLVAAIRQDVETRSDVSTIDNGETAVGQIATVLALDRAQDGEAGHYGFASGRSAPIPAPTGP